MTPSIIDIDISQAEQIISSGIDQQMQFNVTCNFRGQPAFEEGVWLDVTADDLDEDGNIGDLMGDFRIECTPGQVQHITEWLNKYAPTRAAKGGSFVGRIVEKTKRFLGNNENPDGDKALLDMGIGIIGLNSLSNYQKKIILEPINNPDYFFSKIYNPSTKLYTSKKQSKFSAFMGNRDKTSAFDDWKIAMEKAEIPHRIIGKAINVANDKILLSGGINPDLLIGYQKETVLEPIKKPWLYFSNSAYSTKSKQFALNDWIADMRKSDIPSDIVKKAIALNKDYNTGDVVELSEMATGGRMNTESVTIKPYIYYGWSSAKNKPTVWVDTKYAHPDPLKAMIWGYSAQVGDVSDFKNLFEAAGPGVVLEYNVPSAYSANQAKSLRVKTIRDYVSASPNTQFAKGGSVRGVSDSRDKNGLLYALQEFVSAGTVAANTNATTYDQVAEIRAKAIDMLRENGDQPYSLSALVSLLKRAENALVPSDEMMVGLIEKHNQQEWRKRLGGGNLLVGNDILGNKIQNTYRELSSAFELWELWNTSQTIKRTSNLPKV